MFMHPLQGGKILAVRTERLVLERLTAVFTSTIYSAQEVGMFSTTTATLSYFRYGFSPSLF